MSRALKLTESLNSHVFIESESVAAFKTSLVDTVLSPMEERTKFKGKGNQFPGVMFTGKASEVPRSRDLGTLKKQVAALAKTLNTSATVYSEAQGITVFMDSDSFERLLTADEPEFQKKEESKLIKALMGWKLTQEPAAVFYSVELPLATSMGKEPTQRVHIYLYLQYAKK